MKFYQASLFIFFSMLLNSCKQNESDLNILFKENNLNLQLDHSFVLKNKSTLPRVFLAENSRKHDLIKINLKTVKDHAHALEEVKKAIILMAAQFEFTMAPYPGQITEAANCGAVFRPKLKYESGIYYILAFSNERLALSICEGDEYNYKTAMAFFTDDTNSQLIIVEYYQNKLTADLQNATFFKEHFKNYKNIELAKFQHLVQ